MGIRRNCFKIASQNQIVFIYDDLKIVLVITDELFHVSKYVWLRRTYVSFFNLDFDKQLTLINYYISLIEY